MYMITLENRPAQMQVLLIVRPFIVNERKIFRLPISNQYLRINCLLTLFLFVSYR